MTKQEKFTSPLLEPTLCCGNLGLFLRHVHVLCTSVFVGPFSIVHGLTVQLWIHLGSAGSQTQEGRVWASGRGRVFGGWGDGGVLGSRQSRLERIQFPFKTSHSVGKCIVRLRKQRLADETEAMTRIQPLTRGEKWWNTHVSHNLNLLVLHLVENVSVAQCVEQRRPRF